MRLLATLRVGWLEGAAPALLVLGLERVQLLLRYHPDLALEHEGQARPLLLSLLCRSSTRRSSGPFRTSPSAQVLGHTALFYRTSPRRLIKLDT